MIDRKGNSGAERTRRKDRLEGGGTTRSEPAPSYFLDENMGRLLLIGFRIFERSLVRHMAEQGYSDIRMSHLPIMRNVARGGARTTEIAEMTKITKQTAGALAGELETLRYLVRAPDPTDGRAKIVRFTPRGKRFMADFPAALRQAEEEMKSFVGEPDFERLGEILLKLVRSSQDDLPAAFAPD